MAAPLGAAGSAPPSVCAQLAPGPPLNDAHTSHLQLRLPLPPGMTSDAAAATVLAAFPTKPAWVAARCYESLEFVAVWGGKAQPIRQKVKTSLAKWLRLGPDSVKEAFEKQGLTAWRFEAIPALRRLRYEPSAAGRPAELDFSVAGDLTNGKLNELLTELQGSSAWSEKERDLASRADELMKRHVYGDEDMDTRLFGDRAFLAEHLRRKGAENFVKDMRRRVREAELKGQTLVSLCTAASGGAQAFTTAAEVNGSGWQLEICAALATPPHQIRGVLALGPPRCGKCHVGHQLYEALPPGTVVKAQEADKADIYTFGTKRGASAVLLQIDEFEAKAPLAKMRNLLEPHNTGFEVRTGSSKAGQTHKSLPSELRVLITPNRKKRSWSGPTAQAAPRTRTCTPSGSGCRWSTSSAATRRSGPAGTGETFRLRGWPRHWRRTLRPQPCPSRGSRHLPALRPADPGSAPRRRRTSRPSRPRRIACAARRRASCSAGSRPRAARAGVRAGAR